MLQLASSLSLSKTIQGEQRTRNSQPLPVISRSGYQFYRDASIKRNKLHLLITTVVFTDRQIGEDEADCWR